MKKIVLFILIISLQSCTVPYDAETRLLFEAKMVDSNENPIPNATLKISVTNGSSGYGANSETINFGKTNGNGEILLGFPAPVENYTVNISSDYNEISGFVPYNLDNISLSEFTNFKLVLPKLYRLTSDEGVSINYNFFRTNPNRKIISFKVNGIYSPSYSNFYDDNQLSYSNTFFAKKNQNLQIMYQYQDTVTGIIESVNLELSVGNESIDANINF